MTTVSAEARGDWSVFKGDEYHIAFGLYSLFVEQSLSIAFYEWTLGGLLSGNLLYNFLANVRDSEKTNNTWDIRLVSPVGVNRTR